MNFLQKSVAARYRFGRKPPSKDIDPVPRTQGFFLNRDQRSGFDRGIQELRDNGKSRRRRLQGFAPFSKVPHDFKSVLFRDVLVGTGHNPGQNIFKWRLRGIVRRQAKISEWKIGRPIS